MRKYYSARRRAAMHRGDDIIHLEVFERDNWICHICQEKINKHLRGDNWMRATLDHVLPLALGGQHTYENIRASHWICNMNKGCAMPFVDHSDFEK